VLDTSSFGHVHETRNINVEANLLAQRLEERERVLAAAKKRLALTGLVLISSLVCLPMLFRLQAEASARAAQLSSRASEVAGALATLQKQHDAQQPKLAGEEMRKAVEQRAKLFLGNLCAVLNAVPESMVLGSIKAEALSGEMRIGGQANAEAYANARGFLAAAGAGENVLDMVLSATHRNDALGPTGVSFDFVKRVRLSE
jgi:hypothetical protein